MKNTFKVNRKDCSNKSKTIFSFASKEEAMKAKEKAETIWESYKTAVMNAKNNHPEYFEKLNEHKQKLKDHKKARKQCFIDFEIECNKLFPKGTQNRKKLISDHKEGDEWSKKFNDSLLCCEGFEPEVTSPSISIDGVQLHNEYGITYMVFYHDDKVFYRYYLNNTYYPKHNYLLNIL